MLSGDALTPARPLHMSQPYSAGALYSTAADLHAFVRALHGDFLSDEDSTAMFTPGQGNYGFGWGIVPMEGQPLVTHTGGVNGFNAYIGYLPRQDVAVVVLSNVEGGLSGQTGRDVLRVLTGQEVAPPVLRRTVALAPEALADLPGVYRLAPGFALTVSLQDGQLFIQGTGQQALPVFAEAPDRFFSRVVDAQFTFQRDAGGRVTGLTLHQNGRDMPAARE